MKSHGDQTLVSSSVDWTVLKRHAHMCALLTWWRRSAHACMCRTAVIAGVIGYTVRPNFRSGGPYSLREYGPPRTQLPKEYGPSKILCIQGIQSGVGGGLKSLIEWRFDFDDPVYSVYN